MNTNLDKDFMEYMKTIYIAFIAVATLALPITGCATSETSGISLSSHSQELFPILITNSHGQTISIEKPPERIISLSPAHTEIFYAIGAGDRLVGRDRFSDFPPETSEKAVVGDAFSLNLEAIVALEPDLVYTTFEGPIDPLEGLGIDVLYLEPALTVEGVLDNIRLIGRITLHEEEAKGLADDIAERISAVVNMIPDGERSPRVFYEIDPGLFTVGPNSFIGNVLNMLSVNNVASDARNPYPQLSLEAIVEADPEIILLGDSKEFLQNGITTHQVTTRPGWGNITAVRNGEIHPFDDSLLSRPGPRLADGVEQLAELFYPGELE